MQYRRRDSMARLYELSPRTVDTILKEMIRSERYPEDFCLQDYGYTLIEEDAFRDYLRYRRTLKSAPMMVPRYIRVEKSEPIYIKGA